MGVVSRSREGQGPGGAMVIRLRQRTNQRLSYLCWSELPHKVHLIRFPHTDFSTDTSCPRLRSRRLREPWLRPAARHQMRKSRSGRISECNKPIPSGMRKHSTRPRGDGDHGMFPCLPYGSYGWNGCEAAGGVDCRQGARRRRGTVVCIWQSSSNSRRTASP